MEDRTFQAYAVALALLKATPWIENMAQDIRQVWKESNSEERNAT